MKLTFLLTALLLLFSFSAEAQITRYYDAENLFEDVPTWKDSITTTYYTSPINNETGRLSYLNSGSGAANTIYSMQVDNRAYGSHFIGIYVDSLSGTTNTAISMGVFRGYGTVPSTSAPDSTGILWKHLYTASADNSVTNISLTDSTWWTDFPAPYYYFKIVETGNQKNRYYFSDFSFKQD